MMDMHGELFDIYLAEMREHLELLNESLLNLENHPENPAYINSAFRAFHTMKGSTATMSFTHTAEIIHDMEDLLQGVRDGKLVLVADMLQLLFQCHDFISDFVDTVSETRSEEGVTCPGIISRVRGYLSGIKKDKPQARKPDLFEPDKVRAPEPSRAPDAKMQVPVSDGRLPLIPGPSEYAYLRRKIEAGYRAYCVWITLDPACQFKSVRAWMAYHELEQEAEMILYNPPRPEFQEFTDGSVQLESDTLGMLVLSLLEGEELRSHLDSMLMEVASILVEGWNPDQPVLAVPASAKTAEVADSFSREMINQIRIAEHYCLEMGQSRNYLALAGKFRVPVHIIREMARQMRFTHLYILGAEMEVLLDGILEDEVVMDDFHLNYLVVALEMMRTLVERGLQGPDPELEKRIEEHLNSVCIIRSPRGAEMPPEPANDRKLGEILVSQGVVAQEAVEDALLKQQTELPNMRLGQILVREEKAALKQVVDALDTQAGRQEMAKSQSYIRIPEQKVDSLVDMLGELLIIESLHKQEISNLMAESNRADNRLSNNIIRMERITKDIQMVSMSLRMVSLKQTFQKMLRVGRDTAQELHKSVNFTLLGEDTEIDRSVVEKIQDPLMHILRNSISHGIEPGNVRQQNGKPETGQVTIHAYNNRGFVYIEVGDDGKGMQVDKILQKAREKNLVDPGRTYSDDDILRFIYLPGFSTQDEINSISGRGVGMNVVETEIEKLGGRVEINNSPGMGCVMILKIPINLATINGTVVDIFNGRYILPTLSVKKLFKPEEDQWVTIKGQPDMIRLRDDIMQLIPVDRILGIPREEYDLKDGLMIVLEQEKHMRALPVRSVLGKQEIVVKPLGPDFRSLDYVSGATILGDGKVSLILDVEALFKWNLNP